jgi:hypothetical protein
MVEVFHQGQLEQLCSERLGPINESSLHFVSRMFSKLVKYITHPPTFNYELSDLIRESSIDPHKSIPIHPFNIVSSKHNCSISCVLWEIVNPSLSKNNDTCIIYLHTNTRSLADTKEILPFAESIQANVVGIDLPGSGKSSGYMTNTTYEIISELLEVCKQKFKFKRFILWGRGTGTYPIMQLLASLPPAHRSANTIVFTVLDTPFSSFKLALDDIIQKYERHGNYFPHTLFNIFSKVIRVSIHGRIGIDLYDLSPLSLCRSISVPSLILAATNDDYIGIHHGQQIASVSLLLYSIACIPYCLHLSCRAGLVRAA